jgi:hypothetical protein
MVSTLLQDIQYASDVFIRILTARSRCSRATDSSFRGFCCECVLLALRNLGRERLPEPGICIG